MATAQLAITPTPFCSAACHRLLHTPRRFLFFCLCFFVDFFSEVFVGLQRASWMSSHRICPCICFLLAQVLGDTDSSFEEAWEAGTLPGWSSGRALAAVGAAGGAEKGAGAAPRVLDLKK